MSFKTKLILFTFNNLIIKAHYIRILILLVGYIFFSSGIGYLHLFDWDEINFAESAREMIITGDYSLVQINFQPFWEKPPLFTWMQVVSMKIFGINSFAARLPNVICGIITLLVLFEIGKKIKNTIFGFLWALTYFGSILSFLYFKSGIIDPWFNIFIFLSLYFFYVANNEKTDKSLKSRYIYFFLSGIILGLAVLTKGPVAYLLFGLTLFFFLLLKKKFKTLSWKGLIVFSIMAIVVGASYHIYLIFSGRGQVLIDFILYQIRLAQTEDAGHGGFFMYHFVVLLVGMFPASFFVIPSFFKKEKGNLRDIKFFFSCLFWVVLIVFSIVNTKIVHYSSLCYFPLTFLATTYIYDIIVEKTNFSKWLNIAISTMLGILFFIPIIVLWIVNNVDYIESLDIIKDDFAMACLYTQVLWSGWEFWICIFVIIALCFWIFSQSLYYKIIALYFSTATFFLFILFFYLPKIENYSQRPAIEMIKKYDDNSAWISTIGYKSYAPYFYAKRQYAPTEPHIDENTFLLNENINKPVFFIVKANMTEDILNQYPQLVFIEKRGGFSLLRKK